VEPNDRGRTHRRAIILGLAVMALALLVFILYDLARTDRTPMEGEMSLDMAPAVLAAGSPTDAGFLGATFGEETGTEASSPSLGTDAPQPDAPGPPSAADDAVNGQSLDSTVRIPGTWAGDRHGLHGRMESLPNGRTRITYDFEQAEQVLDWSTPHSCSRMTVQQGEWHVWWDAREGGGNSLAIYRLSQPMQIDRLAFRARIVQGNHINWYVVEPWQAGEWCQDSGISGVHRWDGQVLCVDGDERQVSGAIPTEEGREYQVEVEFLADRLSWTIDGVTTWVNRAIHRTLEDHLGLGCWESHVAFDDIVIEGTLGPP
jgi:hypothetical protein